MSRLALSSILLLAAPAAAQDLGGGALSEVPESVYGEPRVQTPGSGFTRSGFSWFSVVTRSYSDAAIAA